MPIIRQTPSDLQCVRLDLRISSRTQNLNTDFVAGFTNWKSASKSVFRFTLNLVNKSEKVYGF